MRSLSCIFLSLITVATVAQPKEQLIVGEWIEVRHENRDGYVVTVLGHVNEPSIRLNFKADGTGTFYNANLPEDLPEQHLSLRYWFRGDTLLVFGRLYDIVQLDKTKLVLIFRRIGSPPSDDDRKAHFIRKEHYEKLNLQQRNQLKAPTKKDSIFLDNLIAERKRAEELYGDRPKSDYLQKVDKMPTYPGGEGALQQFIKKNTKVPESFIGSAKVDMTFIVEPTGDIAEIRILNGLQRICDEEALRVIKLMPKWVPGEHQGKKVRVLAKVSIPFTNY